MCLLCHYSPNEPVFMRVSIKWDCSSVKQLDALVDFPLPSVCFIALRSGCPMSLKYWILMKHDLPTHLSRLLFERAAWGESVGVNMHTAYCHHVKKKGTVMTLFVKFKKCVIPVKLQEIFYGYHQSLLKI